MASDCSSDESHLKLKAEVGRRLPGLEESTMTEVLQLFQNLGVKTLKDLEYVKPEDLLSVLTVVQARKILKARSEITVQGLWEILTRLLDFFEKHGTKIITILTLIVELLGYIKEQSSGKLPNSGRSLDLADKSAFRLLDGVTCGQAGV